MDIITGLSIDTVDKFTTVAYVKWITMVVNNCDG